VEEHNGDDYFAACEHIPGECEPTKLIRKQLLLYEISVPRLLEKLRTLFELD